MAANTDKVRDELEETLASIISLRDEIRVQVHLASQEARARWSALEDELHSVQVAAIDASETLRQAMTDFQVSLKASHEANKRAH